MIMASGTIDARYTAKLLVPRLALAAVAANTSLALCGALIALDNALVAGLLGSTPGASVVGELGSMVGRGGAVAGVIGAFVAIAAAVLAMLLVALFVGRDLVLLLATVAAPLALATYALPQTDEIARLWWRVFVGLLFVQVVQAVLVELGVQVLRHADWLGGPVSDLTSGLVLITLLYILFKLPFAAYQWAFGQSLSHSAPARTAAIAARSVVAMVP